MSRPQLQTDSIDIFQRMPFGSWEWAVTLDTITNSAKYGNKVCGNILYTILTDESVPQETDLVFKNGNTITFLPEVRHQPGLYSLRLLGYLEEYPGVQTYEVFTVEVTAC